jgi:hypothetical protein
MLGVRGPPMRCSTAFQKSWIYRGDKTSFVKWRAKGRTTYSAIASEVELGGAEHTLLSNDAHDLRPSGCAVDSNSDNSFKPHDMKCLNSRACIRRGTTGPTLVPGSCGGDRRTSEREYLVIAVRVVFGCKTGTCWRATMAFRTGHGTRRSRVEG